MHSGIYANSTNLFHVRRIFLRYHSQKSATLVRNHYTNHEKLLEVELLWEMRGKWKGKCAIWYDNDTSCCVANEDERGIFKSCSSVAEPTMACLFAKRLCHQLDDIWSLKEAERFHSDFMASLAIILLILTTNAGWPLRSWKWRTKLILLLK